MNVLSLFDGISCGQVALQRAGIKVTNYYASEIDPHAIKVTQKNYPGTQQLGSVTDLINIDWGNIDGRRGQIDLLIGGSPCQGFSFAGKQLNFNDERSKLFFEYVRILEEIRAKNPDIKFLLENVVMKKEYQKVINELLGSEPITVNSNLVSAQNRKRLYWTNINGFVAPDDRNIFLRDILLYDNEPGQAARIVGRRINDQGVREDYNLDIPLIQYMEPNGLGKTNCLTTVGKDNLILTQKAIDYMNGLRNGKQRWEYHSNPINGKAACLAACFHKKIPYLVIKELLRYLHPIECERLQTLPDNYTDGISNTQRYKSLGNGWTVDVIVEFFKHL